MKFVNVSGKHFVESLYNYKCWHVIPTQCFSSFEIVMLRQSWRSVIRKEKDAGRQNKLCGGWQRSWSACRQRSARKKTFRAWLCTPQTGEREALMDTQTPAWTGTAALRLWSRCHAGNKSINEHVSVDFSCQLHNGSSSFSILIIFTWALLRAEPPARVSTPPLSL